MGRDDFQQWLLTVRAIAVLGCAPLLTGCDLGGTYSKRYEQSLVSVGKKAETAAMLHGQPTAVPDAAEGQSGVQLELPSILDGNSKSLPNTEVRAPAAVREAAGTQFRLRTHGRRPG